MKQEEIEKAEKLVEEAEKKSDEEIVDLTVTFGKYTQVVKPMSHKVAKKLMAISRENISLGKDLHKIQLKQARALDALKDVQDDSAEEHDLEARIDKIQNSMYEYSDTLADNKIKYIVVALGLNAEEVEDYPEIFLNKLVDAINDRAGITRIGSKND